MDDTGTFTINSTKGGAIYIDELEANKNDKSRDNTLNSTSTSETT